jgi:hypothetical protein
MPRERKGVTAVPSRQWSCSEMFDGHKALVKAKEERESDDEIQNRIQDSLSIKLTSICFYALCFCEGVSMPMMAPKEELIFHGRNMKLILAQTISTLVSIPVDKHIVSLFVQF